MEEKTIDELDWMEVELKRDQLKTLPECTFVEPDEYCRLAVSTRKMVRSDEPLAEVRGLMDLETGQRFLTEDEKLFPRRSTPVAVLS